MAASAYHITRFSLYKQLFYKERQAEIGKKLSNTLWLNFWCTCPKNKFFCVNEIIWLIVMKMKMIMKKQVM